MRTLTIAFEVDPSHTQDWHWIYEAMKVESPVNGLKIFALSEGNAIEDMFELERKLDFCNCDEDEL